MPALQTRRVAAVATSATVPPGRENGAPAVVALEHLPPLLPPAWPCPGPAGGPGSRFGVSSLWPHTAHGPATASQRSQRHTTIRGPGRPVHLPTW